MADTRIFRLTRSRHAGIVGRRRYGKPPPDTRVEYGDKRVASAKCGGGGHSYTYGSVVKVEATNADATLGWTDVTDEFIKERDD